MTTGEPAGPAGCREGLIVLVIVVLLISAFVAITIWIVRDAIPK